jgi:hypothetical protein
MVVGAALAVGNIANAAKSIVNAVI